jgi:hypothetical protein
MCTVVAITFISTSLSFGVGFSTSLICRTSGGPYLVHTIAFISVDLKKKDRHKMTAFH